MTGEVNDSFDERIKGFSVASLKKDQSKEYFGMTEEKQSLIKVEYYQP